MPRMPRIKSKSGIYHIVMRGINRQTVFEDEEDCHKFIQTLQKYREISEYKLYAYCLMGNHLHLLLMEYKEPLETVMRRICGSYVLWYNKKHGRVGYLFQDRFKSEPVEDDAYFLTVLRYIFQNPVKAGIAARVEDYLWTNYTDYIGEKYQADRDYALDILNVDREKAVKKFIEYINKDNDDKCLEIKESQQITDNDAIKIIKAHCKIEQGLDLQMVDVDKRNRCIKELKEGYGLSIRQIERLTGISRGIIQRV
ncbi:transposase [Geosporobacter ferrireducens]|uniref:Transposase n=1 Tax=Geosporobacter ferrireducens TaxID=1424294 RepID=A0A1D8GHI0_9FIRM|nr:transposase [Geosporobacter ferrireducens]AOT70378.1 transposase [Geosporobacter ferrireducens]MTI54355.1 transposase [Geosporobacter ferrireducens]